MFIHPEAANDLAFRTIGMYGKTLAAQYGVTRVTISHERLLGSGEMVSTQLHNGYGPCVAQFYPDKKYEKLFM